MTNIFASIYAPKDLLECSVQFVAKPPFSVAAAAAAASLIPMLQHTHSCIKEYHFTKLYMVLDTAYGNILLL